MSTARSARSDVSRARSSVRRATSTARILVVDDEESTRLGLQKLLRGDGFAISTAANGEAALAEVRRALPDVVLADLHMPGMDGVELCTRLHEMDPDLPVIIMTGDADVTSIIESLRSGATDYFVKPLQFEMIRWRLEVVIERRNAMREQAEVQRALNERLVVSSIREQEFADAAALERTRLNALLENMSDGIAMADGSGRIRLLNDAARAILGFERGDPLTVDALHALDARDLKGQRLASDQRPLMRALRGEQFRDYEVIRKRPKGDDRRVVSTGTSVRDEKGSVVLAIIVFRDVTELRRLEQQRDEYLALISHDLRNPLAVVSMSLATMKRSMNEAGPARSIAACAELAERGERNIKRMTAMLEELTESASMEAEGVALQRAACDMRELVDSVVDSIDDARARRIRIETDGTASYLVFADAPRLERVVANLLTNALKYSGHDAPVNVRLARTGTNVELDVIDQGIGIARDSMTRLFERYYRTERGKARASGLGLGLYIARLIAEAHGGRLEVSSELGKGSTFKLILAAPGAPTVSSSPPPVS